MAGGATPGIIARILRKVVESNPFMQRKLYEVAYFPQLGLMRDDCYAFDHKYVKEAILRLPKEVREERQFRIIRATTLSAAQKVLPKNEWMTYDQDKPYLYPYIEEIRSEKEEKAALTKYQYAYRAKRDPVLDRKVA